MWLLCIDTGTNDVRRYQAAGDTFGLTHEGGFVPNGNRGQEIEALEAFRKFPAQMLIRQEPTMEDYLWTTQEGS